MEEQRIGRMYINLLTSWVRGVWDGLLGGGLKRSLVLPLIVILIIAIPAIGWYLHLQGKFHQLKRGVQGESQASNAQVPRPGGADAVVLKRTETPGSDMPEFLSAIILPGMGMDILQITANLPGRGEVPLLSAPSLEAVADGTEEHPAGAIDLHGAIEAPWAGTLAGILSPLATSMTTPWHGHVIEVATNSTLGRAAAEGGLLIKESADATQTARPNGAAVTGIVRQTDFSGHWPSKSDVTTTVQMDAHAIDITITARNTGMEPQPMGLGWSPRFAIPGGDRSAVELKLPAGEMLEVGERLGALPSGKIVPAGPSVSRFQGHFTVLGGEDVEAGLTHLKSGVVDMGPAVELRDPAAHFGLRLTALSVGIRELRVSSPTGSSYIQLGLQTNLDDPTGREWTAEDGGGIAALQPGQALEWKIRLEIFPLSVHSRATP